MLKNKKTLIFHIEGGMGKNIAATAVTASVKKQFPDIDIIVVCGWDEVWIGNPDIKRVYNFQNISYFYEDYIKNKSKDTFILRQDPYFESSYILRQSSLLKAWGELLEIKVTESPKLVFSQREIDFASNLMELDGRPIFMIHPCGGADMQGTLPYSWARDIPPVIAQEVINRMNNAGYRVIQIARQNQRAFQGVQVFSSSTRSTMLALKFSYKRLLIDSFAQHAAAALELPSTVLWIANTPEMLGYGIHTNIVCEKEMREDATRKSYLEPFNILGALEEYPYDSETLFDVDRIIETLLEKPQTEKAK